MNDYRRELLLSIAGSLDGLRDGLEILLREEERDARGVRTRPGGRVACTESMRVCRALAQAVALAEAAAESAEEAAGRRAAAAG